MCLNFCRYLFMFLQVVINALNREHRQCIDYMQAVIGFTNHTVASLKHLNFVLLVLLCL